jgi:hypothetical protein
MTSGRDTKVRIKSSIGGTPRVWREGCTLAQPLKGRAQPLKGRAQPLKGRAQPLKGRAQPLKGRSQPPTVRKSGRGSRDIQNCRQFLFSWHLRD